MTSRWQCLITFNTCPVSVFLFPTLSISFSIFIPFSLETEIVDLLRARACIALYVFFLFFAPLMRLKLFFDSETFWCMWMPWIELRQREFTIRLPHRAFSIWPHKCCILLIHISTKKGETQLENLSYTLLSPLLLLCPRNSPWPECTVNGA